MGDDRMPVLQGTLDLLILKALAGGELHGVGAARRVEEITGGAFAVGPGSLFPALQRMEGAGWIEATWGQSEAGRRARYYRLTRAGKKQLKLEADAWSRISLAMANALHAT